MKYDNKSIAERGLWVVLILGITFVLGWYPIDMFAGVMVMLFAIQSLFRGFNGEGKYRMVYQLLGVALIVLAVLTARLG